MDPNVSSEVILLCLINFFISPLGNALVVTAVVCFKRLRSVTNFFVISLAIADITVSISEMM